MMNNTQSGGTENSAPDSTQAAPVSPVTPPAEAVAAAPAKAPARARAPAKPKVVKAAPAATPAKPAGAKAPAAKPAASATLAKAAKKAPAAPKAAKEVVKVEKKEKEKDKKEKVVRDSFSMPKSEHGIIKQLRTEIAQAGRIVSKSEILRAALKSLASQGAAQVVGLIETLPSVPKGKAKKS